MERPWGRTLRAVALLVFTATAFLPLHACLAAPRRAGGPPAAGSGRRYVPAEVIARAARAPDRPGLASFLWATRNVYPYLLAPVWAALLLAAEVGTAEVARRRARRVAGGVAAALAVAIAAFELAYIRTDYTGVLPRTVLAEEQLVAWGVVVVVLFARRRGRGLLEPEAAVSAQALLAAFHALTFPAADLRRHLADGHRLGPVVETLVTNYRPGFVVAVVALAAVALPGYLRPRDAGAPPAGPGDVAGAGPPVR